VFASVALVLGMIALVVNVSGASAPGRQYVVFEKLCTPSAAGGPVFDITNVTNAPITLTITDRYSLGGSSKVSPSMTVQPGEKIEWVAPGGWPWKATWGKKDKDHKYYAHFLVNGKKTNSPEYCACGAPGTTTSTSTTSTTFNF
jgi:hypothetical protein